MSNHEHEHCGCGCEHHDHKPMTDKYMTAVNQSNVTTDDAAVAAAVQEIIDKHAAENNTTEVQQFLLNCVDLTTLATEDSERSVAQFVQKVNDFDLLPLVTGPYRDQDCRDRIGRCRWCRRGGYRAQRGLLQG